MESWQKLSDTAALEADRGRCGIWSSGSLWRGVDTAAVFGYCYKNESTDGKSCCWNPGDLDHTVAAVSGRYDPPLLWTERLENLSEAVCDAVSGSISCRWDSGSSPAAGRSPGFSFLGRFLYLFYQDVKEERKYCYPVVLKYGKQKVNAIGYLDTGNQLVRPKDRVPVHVVSEQVWKQLFDGADKEEKIPGEILPFSTIGNPYGQMEAMQIEEILLKFEHGRKKVLEKPWIARAPFPISRGNRYQILLHGETDPESTMS